MSSAATAVAADCAIFLFDSSRAPATATVDERSEKNYAHDPDAGTLTSRVYLSFLNLLGGCLAPCKSA